MDATWINSALIILGVVLLTWSVIYYLGEYLHAGYASMGAEMSFSHYWLVAMLLILLGLLPLLSLSRWWALLLIAPLYLLSIPVRRMLKSLAYHEDSSTG